MSEKNEKKLYFVLIVSIIYLIISICVFIFLFGSYDNSILSHRIHFLGWNIFLYLIVLVTSFAFADSIYND